MAVSAVVTSVAAVSAVAAGAQGRDAFDDIDEAGVHARSVEALAQAGIVEGTDCRTGRFCPDEPIDRWVMAVWLVRAVDGRDSSSVSVSRFADVDSRRWWAAHVERLAELGITSGCATGPARFCPEDSVTRAQMATFLTRAFGLDAAPSAGFADTAGNIHAANIDAIAAGGITAGCATDPLRYCPHRAVTRAQMATFLARALGLVPLPTVTEPTELPDRLAYVSYGAIYVADADSSNEKRLTIDNSNPGDDFIGDFNLAWSDWHPSWSPDRTRIAFVSSRSSTAGDLYVMDSDGNNVEKLAGSAYPDWSGHGSPSWSPDGTRIAFAGRGARLSSRWRGTVDMANNIFIVDADGANVRRLTADGGFDPDWSPDGTRIAFAGSTGTYTSDIFTMDTGGHNVVRLTYGGGRSPSWSPDGTRIAFESNQEVFVMDSDGSNIRQLSNHGGSNPDWSPDGSRIAYESTHLFVNPYSDWHIYALAESHGIIVMNSDGTGLRRITDGAHDPVWAPSPTGGRRPATPSSSPTEFSAVTTGGVHSCGIRTDETVTCWGSDDVGQSSPPTGTFATVSAGETHSCATRTDGTLACWGYNWSGEASPPRSGRFTAVAAGSGHSCAIRTDGRLACWGNSPTAGSSVTAARFIAITAGDNLSCGLRTDGRLACWGDNTDGQASPPTGKFTAISTGSDHSCGIRTDGSVACWGDNTSGEASPPTGKFTAISAGRSRSCGIRTDGSMVCWGYIPEESAPPRQGTFTAVAAGGWRHSCGLRSDGTAACWGSSNYWGQLSPPLKYTR